MRRPVPFAWLAPSWVVITAPVQCAAQEWTGSVTAEVRAFPSDASLPDQPDALSLSGAAEVGYDGSLGDGVALRILGFGRLDQNDSSRSHLDLRQAALQVTRDALSVDIGVHSVFWGVTESRHLVDVINQTDELERIGTERKLGQPMIRLALYTSTAGFFELIATTGFRPRRYPSAEGRPGVPVAVAYDDTEYESDLGRWQPGAAARWSHVVGDLSGAVSAFRGTAREPELVPVSAGSDPAVRPRYALIHQAGLELQWTRGDWLWKAEGMVREGQGPTFAATTFGLEHTRYGLAGTAADVALIVEYSYDGRDNLTLTVHDDDLFGGVRLTPNDFAGTELEAGALVDLRTGAVLADLEFSRRLGGRWMLELRARLFSADDPTDPLTWFRGDDHLEGRLRFYP